jgi:hypothetical protein
MPRTNIIRRCDNCNITKEHGYSIRIIKIKNKEIFYCDGCRHLFCSMCGDRHTQYIGVELKKCYTCINRRVTRLYAKNYYLL